MTMLVVLLLQAQVGINNEAPLATLDISKSSVSTINSGVLIPRLKKGDFTAMTAGVTAVQNSLLIYATEPFSTDVSVLSDPANSKYYWMDREGYYYYNVNALKWLRLVTTEPTGLENIAVRDGSKKFAWRFIGINPTNYGTIGKYAVDMQYIPANLSELLVTHPLLGPISYSSITSFNPNYGSTLPGASGENSFVTGVMNVSSGLASQSMGAANISSGLASQAFGVGNLSSGTGAASFGAQNISSGDYSMTVGSGNTATTDQTVAMGVANISDALNAVSIGQENQNYSQASFALGNNNEIGMQGITKFGSIAIGQENQVFSSASSAIGANNVIEDNVDASVALGTGIILNNIDMAGTTFSFGSYPTLETIVVSNVDAPRRINFGNGSKNTTLITNRDALTILRNGKLGINYDNFELSTNAGQSDAILQVNGNGQMKGLYTNIRIGNTILADDHTVILTGNVSLPAPSTNNKGRNIILCGDSATSRVISGTLQDMGGTYTSVSTANVPGEKCYTFQSTGSVWWVISR